MELHTIRSRRVPGKLNRSRSGDQIIDPPAGDVEDAGRRPDTVHRIRPVQPWIGNETCQSAIGEGWVIQQFRVRFTVRKLILMVAGAAFVFAILTACFRWLRYPHVTLTIFNDTPSAIYEVRVRFLYGERTADRIEPGGFAVAEIQSGGDAGVFISYRDSAGNIGRDEPLYYSDERDSADRGFLDVHVTDEGTRLVNGVYTAVDIPCFARHVRPTGRMTVK